MRIQWTLAVLLSAAVAAGCGDRSGDTQNPEGNAGEPVATAPATEEPVAEAPLGGAAPSQGDGSAVRDNRTASGARPASRGAAIAPAPPRTTTPSGSAVAPGRTTEAPAPAPRGPQFREVTVAAGTALPLELTSALSTETAQVETPVRARLRQAVTVDGHTVLPAGATLIGHVTEVERPGRVRGRARLVFRFTEAQFNGQTEDVRTNPITFEGEQTKGEDATKIGGGAVGGAIVGGILGGADGAAKGAAIGGAAGTGVVLATRGRDLELASGADISATVATPFTVRARVD